jgi:signal transduction histidine kinase
MQGNAGSVKKELTSACDVTCMDEWSQADLILALNAIFNLSKEKDLKGVCDHLLKITMEQTGAVKGLLFLKDNSNNIILQSALTNGKTTPKTAYATSILNWVAQNQQMIMLQDVHASSCFCHDNHIKNLAVQSILCIPMILDEKIAAIVYLEDFRKEKTSTNSHLSLLAFIISQAAHFLGHILRYQAMAESEKEYRQLYQKEAERAQTSANHMVTAKKAHDIRAAINAILGYSQLLQAALNNDGIQAEGEIAEYLDQIMSRSWHLLNTFNRVVKPIGSKKRPAENSQIDRYFEKNKSLLTDDAAQYALPDKTSKAQEITSVKLDYDIRSHSDLLEALKKAEQKYLVIMKTMIISDIDAFGAAIAQIGSAFRSSALTKWGETLKAHSANFNKNEMEQMMRWFPEIVRNVEKRQPGRREIKMIH